MAQATRVGDIRKHAELAALQAAYGASGLTLVSSAHTLVDAGIVDEHDGDLHGAFDKYLQATNLLNYIMSTEELQRDFYGDQRGVLYQQTIKLGEHITSQVIPRAKKIEERLLRMERDLPPPPPSLQFDLEEPPLLQEAEPPSPQVAEPPSPERQMIDIDHGTDSQVQPQAAGSRNRKPGMKSKTTSTTRTAQGVAQPGSRHDDSSVGGLGKASARVRIQTPTVPTHSRDYVNQTTRQSRSRTQSEVTADSVGQVADELQNLWNGPGGPLPSESQSAGTSAERKESPKISDGSQEILPDTETVAISSLMSASEIATHLCDHGCRNITDRLDLSSCSPYPLSSGGFGDVYRGKLNNGTPVAIKTMRLQMNPSESGQKPLKHAARELHTWSKCKHPNVVELLGLVEFRGQIGMVSPWMENGSLPSYLAQHQDVDRCQLSTKISEGLAYLHRCNIVHGDLKGLNVLISNRGTPLLADFGNAILQGRTLQFTRTTVKYSASPRWAAPEIIEGSSTYSFAADVYALGMTILETITGRVPYSDKGDHAVYFAVGMKREHPQRPEEQIPSDSQHGNTLWSMLTRCWAYEAEARPRADDVLDIMKTITRAGLVRISDIEQLVAAGWSENATSIKPREQAWSEQPVHEVRPEVPSAGVVASEAPASASKSKYIPSLNDAPSPDKEILTISEVVPSSPLLPWQRVHQWLLRRTSEWSFAKLSEAIASTEHGHQIDEIALTVWCTQTYKRYVRVRMSETGGDASKIDRMYVPPTMADAISTAVYNGRHGDACQMLKDMWAPFELDTMPRLIIVLARHRRDEHHWVTHRFSLPDGQLSTYDTYPERMLPDARPLGWWFAIRSAWPHSSYPPADAAVQKMVRINRPLQPLADCSVAAAGIWRNLLMGGRADRSVDLERLRDLISTEVKALKQRKEMGRLTKYDD